MVFDFSAVAFIVVILWLLVLSLILFQTLSHYNQLTKGLTEKSLRSVLEKFIKDMELTRKDIDYLKGYCVKIQKEGLLHIQKVGLLRFNPFKDTGGDQSFILSLTDSNDTGVIISGLYSRSGTRWYAKRVVNGKSTEHDLSDEEKKTLREAKIHEQ